MRGWGDSTLRRFPRDGALNRLAEARGVCRAPGWPSMGNHPGLVDLQPAGVSTKPDFRRSGHQDCHPERSEGSCTETLRSAQNDLLERSQPTVPNVIPSGLVKLRTSPILSVRINPSRCPLTPTARHQEGRHLSARTVPARPTVLEIPLSWVPSQEWTAGSSGS